MTGFSAHHEQLASAFRDDSRADATPMPATARSLRTAFPEDPAPTDLILLIEPLRDEGKPGDSAQPTP